MAEKIYRLAFVDTRPEWLTLDEAVRHKMIDSLNNSLESVGGKRIVTCDMRWSTEEWKGFVVTEFPDMDAVLKHTAEVEGLDYFHYRKARSYLGVPTRFGPGGR